MRKIVICALMMSGVLPGSALALTDTLKTPLDAALATGNVTVIDATANHLIHLYPEEGDAIATYLVEYRLAQQQDAVEEPQKQVAGTTEANVPANTASAEALGKLAPAAGESAGEEEKSKAEYSGEVAMGLEYASGNSEYENYNASAKLARDSEMWKHAISGKARNNSEDGNRTAEDYRAEYQADYKLSDIDYVFGNLDYVKDRFSGYNYRMSETLGYGRELLAGESYALKGEAGLGMRQTDRDVEGSENEFIQTVKLDFDWDITDNLHFSEELSSTFGQEATITESETTVTTALIGALDLRFTLHIEHIDDVPPGNKNTDTMTGLNLVYGF